MNVPADRTKTLRPGARSAVRLLAVLALACPATARELTPVVPSDLIEAVPADVIAACFNAGARSEESQVESARAFSMATGLLDRASETGLLSSVDLTVRGWIDALVSMAMVLQHPHALVLMDITATPGSEGGHKLGGINAAVIIHATGGHQDLDRRVQHLLSTYTNTDETVLTRESVGGDTMFSIRDRRLDDWATIQWGSMGDLYVVAIGDGAFARVADAVTDRSAHLGADAWFAKAYQAMEMKEAVAGCYVRLELLRPAADRVLARKIERVQDALHLHDVRRVLWTLRREERSFELAGYYQQAEGDDRRVLAGQQFLAGLADAVVPGQASGFMAVNGQPQTLFRAACEAYLASRSAESREEVLAYWRDVELRSGVDVDRDILPHLGGPIVIHNYPKHFLRLPVMWTYAVPVRGDAALLRGHVDRLLAFVDAELAEVGAVRLRRDDDATWWMNLGFSGPAVKISDHWLVLGHSPAAVRENLALLEPQAAAQDKPIPEAASNPAPSDK